MDNSGPYSLPYTGGHLETSQPQIPGGIEINHDHTLPIIDHAGQANSSGNIIVETATWEGDSQFRQLTQTSACDLDVDLATLNLNDGAALSPGPTQLPSLTASLDSPCVVEKDVSVGVVLDARAALKNELDAALNAYHQSREAMLWHAANVCRVNMEYVHALRAANVI